eukprot:4237140-Pyramimonas_sp.AAC.1
MLAPPLSLSQAVLGQSTAKRARPHHRFWEGGGAHLFWVSWPENGSSSRITGVLRTYAWATRKRCTCTRINGGSQSEFNDPSHDRRTRVFSWVFKREPNMCDAWSALTLVEQYRSSQ